MLFTKKNIHRLGVFVFFDKNGIVDDYVLFMLESLKKAVQDLIIVSNCMLSGNEKKKLFTFTDKIKIRQNIGLDAGAFKEVYDDYQNYFRDFDELILVNDTFYGPFVPFKKICEVMEKRDVDFWGLTANYNSVDGFGYLPDNMIHSHIQTFFIAFRGNVLNSKAFREYWENYNIKKMKRFDNVVTKHEIVFTHYLEQAGFKWDVYTNLEKYHSSNLEENFNAYAYASFDLIQNCNCPFIKRKNFVFDKKDILYLTDGEENKKSMEYIEKHFSYDTNMIWKNLIRLYNTEDLYYGLNLNFIVEEQEKSSILYAIVIYLEEEKYLHFFMQFLKNTHIKNIFVFASNSKVQRKLENENIKVTAKKDFDSSKYQYIGIVKDKDLKRQKIFLVYEHYFAHFMLNALESQKYINGILKIFAENFYLGMLLLPESFHSDYFGEIAEMSNKIPCNYNSCFIKSNLFDWEIIEKDSFVSHYLEKAKYKYIVGKIYNKKSIAKYLLNQEYIIKKTYETLGNCNGYVNQFSVLLYHLKHTKRIQIPGRGIILRLYRKFLKIRYKFF